MPTIKQKTIGGTTYELKRYRTKRPGKQYEYYVTKDGGMIDDPVYRRSEAMKEWRATINDIRRAKGKERSRSRGPSLPDFGDRPAVSGEVSIPGLGPVDSDADGDTDDNDQPSLPFF